MSLAGHGRSTCSMHAARGVAANVCVQRHCIFLRPWNVWRRRMACIKASWHSRLF